MLELGIRLAITCLILVACICLYKRFRRRQLLDLNWPNRIGFGTFNRLVKDYLELNGWQILMPNLARHVFIAKRQGCTVQIRCESSQTEFTMSQIRDLRREAVTRKPWPLLCVTVQNVPPHLVRYAAAGEVAIIHYKNMKVFAKENKNFHDWVEDIRGLQATEAEVSSKSERHRGYGLFDGDDLTG